MRSHADMIGSGGFVAAILALAGALSLAPVAAAQSLDCDRLVEDAVRAAAAGRLEEADRALELARARCPDDAGVLREFAGLRFRQERWDDAGRAASRFLELEPGSEWGWDLLASSRYLADDARGALRAWNRIGRPVVEEVRIAGPTRTSADRGGAGGEGRAGGAGGAGRVGPPEGRNWASIVAAAGIREGEVLTPGALTLAIRRLETVPAVSRARLDFRPIPAGRAEVEGAVSFGPGRPWDRSELPAHLLRALGGRVTVSASNVLELRERWILSGLHDGGLHRVTAGFALPAPADLGAWDWLLERSEGTYAPPSGDPARLSRTGVRWNHSHWVREHLRVEALGGLDHWRGTGGAARAGFALQLHLPHTPAVVRFAAEGWSGSGGGRGVGPGGGADERGGVGRFGRAGLGFEAAFPVGSNPRSAPPRPEGELELELDVRAGVEVVSRSTPIDLHPSFGAGRSSTHPMRALSHLDRDGVVRPTHPGTAWAHGGAEVRGWAGSLGPVQTGLAVFADAVRVLSGHPEGNGETTLNLGTGVRTRVPGRRGWLRVDWAVDPSSGASRFSAAFVERDGG